PPPAGAPPPRLRGRQGGEERCASGFALNPPRRRRRPLFRPHSCRLRDGGLRGRDLRCHFRGDCLFPGIGYKLPQRHIHAQSIMWEPGRKGGNYLMNLGQKRSAVSIYAGVSALLALGLLAVVGGTWMSQAAEECCKEGDTTPPVDLVKQVPPGGLHSPYQDYAKLAKDDPDLVKKFRLPGCNECHGGGGGGGMCPALSQGIWFWGNTDDVLFRLV